MNIASLVFALLAPNAFSFEKATKDPLKTQGKILLEYLWRNRNTEYGLKYNFSAIRTIDDYRRLIPLSDCETMRPYLDRMANGETNILTIDRPVFFGATSGTTSQRKYIPTTKYSESKKSGITALWGYYAFRDHPNAIKGKILAIVSTEVEGYTESGIPFGGESGRAYKEMPMLLKAIYSLPYCVFEIKDYEARYYSILRISMEQDITTIMTLNPNTLSLLCQKIEKWQDMIIEDIEKGTISVRYDMQDALRLRLLKGLKPNPKRSAELKAILKEKGGLLPKDFWPHLELIECWKAGSMKLYLKELGTYFGDVHIRDIGCLSTEARNSIPTSDEGAGGVLTVHVNFYEFIPKEDIDKTERRTLLCNELEKGKEYFMVITTPGGLYRYNIDDIVRVDDFFNSAPIIEFVQKGSNAVSLAGEKLYESQLNEAINKVLNQNRLLVEFISALAKTTPPHYEFLVEFAGRGPSLDEKKKFLTAIEEALYDKNKEYEYVRSAQLLEAPILKVVKSGGFEKYKIRKLREGGHDSQFKISELTADQDFENNFQIEEEIKLD